MMAGLEHKGLLCLCCQREEDILQHDLTSEEARFQTGLKRFVLNSALLQLKYMVTS